MATLYDSPLNATRPRPAATNDAATRPAPEAATSQNPAKRRKVTRACDSCKSRKRRCTGELPCSSCWANGAECTYNASYTRGRVVAPTPSAHVAGSAAQSSPRPSEQADGASAEQSRPLPGAQYGLAGASKASGSGSPEHEPATLAGQYSGPTSAYSFLRRAWKRFGLDAQRADEADPHPTSVHVFNYGDKFIPKDPEVLTSFRLPPREESQDLLTTYFDFTMPTYRYLHKRTVSQWLDTYHDQLEGKEGAYLLPSRQAIVLMVLATATLFLPDRHKDEPWRESEPYFQIAQAKLGAESGKARLESVQARIAICLYLLHTSRPNQSWYTFGITCQLMMAIGMHRDRPKAAPQIDAVTCECRRRAFWAAYTIDFYLSVILGRPHMIHDDHSDQRFPQALDDEEVTVDGPAPKADLQKDRVIQASIYHAKITRIVKMSIRTQYALTSQSNEQKRSVATRLNDELAGWKASLPVLLSGAVHPSSLIQIYQRQIVVLRLAYAHAQMLVNRPLMLIDAAPRLDTTPHINKCLEGAKTTIDTVLQYVSDKRMFSIFWHSQYVTFTALSIVYVWLIQRKRGRMSDVRLPFSDEELFQRAETTQSHFAEATENNAPCTRFSIILEELQVEAHRLMSRRSKQQHRPPQLKALLQSSSSADNHLEFVRPVRLPDTASLGHPERAESVSVESLGAEWPLDPDLWVQLDSFPFSDVDFDSLDDAF